MRYYAAFVLGFLVLNFFMWLAQYDYGEYAPFVLVGAFVSWVEIRIWK
jgi:hypothetical protein